MAFLKTIDSISHKILITKCVKLNTNDICLRIIKVTGLCLYDQIMHHLKSKWSMGSIEDNFFVPYCLVFVKRICQSMLTVFLYSMCVDDTQLLYIMY